VVGGGNFSENKAQFGGGYPLVWSILKELNIHLSVGEE